MDNLDLQHLLPYLDSMIKRTVRSETSPMGIIVCSNPQKMTRLVEGILRYCTGVLTVGEEAGANVRVTTVENVFKVKGAIMWFYIVD
jgi:hypothetical protein